LDDQQLHSEETILYPQLHLQPVTHQAHSSLHSLCGYGQL